MKKQILIVTALISFNLAHSQIYKAKSTVIHFLSKAALEDIEATSKHAVMALDAASGNIQVQAQIKAFKFSSSFMEEHFNENYMESEKYPFSTFKGKINEKLDYTKNGEHNVTCTGKMEMHGVSQEVTIPGTIKINGSEVTLEAKFKVKPADYKIKIEGAYAEKIAKEIGVDINAVLEPLKKP
ncbi:MAG: YceI family protein [Bacteroidia bacterium]